MTLALLWIESLVAALLGVATAAAVLSRIPLRPLRQALVAIVLVLPLVAAIVETVVASELRDQGMPGWWFSYTLSWTVVYAIASVWMAWRARRRCAASGTAGATCGAGCIGKCAAVWLVSLVLCGLTYSSANASLQRRMLEAGAEGRALALALAPPAVPDAENAAAVYEEAFEILGLFKNKLQLLDQCGRPDFDPAAPAVKTFLASMEPTLKLLHRAADLPGYRFETDYGRPSPASRTVAIMNTRYAASLLALDARAKAAAGDVKGAVADLVAIRRHAAHLARTPQMISLMMSLAVGRIGCNALEDVLAASTAQADELAPLAGGGEVSNRWALIRSLQMEEAYGLSAFGIFASSENGLDMTGLPLDAPTFVYPPVFLLEDDMAALQMWMRRLERLSEKPYHEAAKDLATFDADFQKAPGGLLTGLAFPFQTRTVRQAATGDACARLSRLALAAAVFRARQGKYPERLDDLVGDGVAGNLVDPFSGMPLKMTAADGGLVLYSVGPNGKDDGGAQKERSGNVDEGDIVFCLGPAYQARRLKPAAASKEAPAKSR